MKYTLKKVSHLRKNRSFQALYRNGKSFVCKDAVLYVLHQSSDISRIGFAVGKKLGNAVVRNRTKRLMREVYRHQQYNIVNGIDIIFVARKPLIGAKISKFNNVFLFLCKKASIFIKE